MSQFFIQEQQLGKNTCTLIKNEAGKSLFLMVGRWGTRGDALSLYTMGGTLVASVRQTSIAFGTRFDLYQSLEKVGSIRKIVSLPPDIYYIHHLHWTVLGNIFTHQYAIYRVNQKLMAMDKKKIFSDDYFVLDVTDDRKAPLCICIASILDYWIYNKQKQSTENIFFKWCPC